jgi:LacI family transcriptional regulator
LRLVDVAERAGVSLATASRSLTGRDGVSEEVASRVRQVAAELGYVANPYARTLAGGASSSVGLVVQARRSKVASSRSTARTQARSS